MARCALLILLFTSCQLIQAQECEIKVSGFVKDHHDNQALLFSNVVIEETGIGAVADTSGFFEIKGICEGTYHVFVSHVGCEPLRFFLKLTSDTVLNIALEHHEEFLDPFKIEGKRQEVSLSPKTIVSKDELNEKAGSSFAEIIETVNGVSTLKNGSGISKPIIHGLYGNRITILNNGIEQAGQQWGNDHAPEIDPFAAKRITVIKGVESIEYGGNGLGGVVLMEPGNIRSEPHIHGSTNYIYRTNGRGHIASLQLEQGGEKIKWRVTGSFKKRGDTHAPDYFLTNTGNQENNFSIQLTKSINDRWFNQVYYSFFSTELGILRGAHIGNLSDLEQAILQKEPFFTRENFSYDINSPRQEVQHQMIKTSTKFFTKKENSFFQFVYGGQRNSRKEFDVRRGGRSGIPALDLSLISHSFNLSFSGISKFKVGLEYKYNENSNDPGTGILPLIPNYESNNAAFFARYKFNKDRFTYELGSRYDFVHFDVNNISRTLPRVVESNEHNFHNYSMASGVKFDNRKRWILTFNAGLVQRSPEINELYSFGLHQGVAGIEEGNSSLKPELGLKLILNNTYYLSEKIFIQADVYRQQISNYIFLAPQDEFRLTIRGAFPVFLYQQTDAQLQGVDLSLNYQPKNNINGLIKYSRVRGKDITNDIPLVYIPADNMYSSINYLIQDKKKKNNFKFGLNGKYVFEQTNLLESQDFQAPPSDYFLMGGLMEWKIKRKKNELTFNVQAYNLLNSKYRDYLNRLRYYADEMGRDVKLSLKLDF